MSELNLKPILRQFLLSITGNDIMQTNNDNYDCIDKFIESDRFKVALKQANVVATGGGQLTIPDVSFSLRDKIAADVVAALINRLATPIGYDNCDIKTLSKEAYDVADEMMKARSNES